MKKGAIAKPIPIGQPEPLVAADLERLKQPRYIPSTPQKLRDSHHMIARLTASGLRPFEVAVRVGYSRERVTALVNSPAMEELIAQYRAKVDEAFVENTDAFFELATSNMLAAERHIADHIAELDEQGELLPVRTALAISRDAADRFGYGKKSQQTNINVDFASALEKAIARSGKQIESNVQPLRGSPLVDRQHLGLQRDSVARSGHSTPTVEDKDVGLVNEAFTPRKPIEGTSSQAPASQPAATPLPRSEAKRVPPLAASPPPPLLRRRA